MFLEKMFLKESTLREEALKNAPDKTNEHFKVPKVINQVNKMIIGIIPARFASTRLHGKPLKLIGDKPMLQHTYETAMKSKLLSDVVIAVDDERVYEEAKKFLSSS